MKRVIPVEEHAESLSIFVRKMFPDRDDVILVAKGEGAEMAFSVAQQNKQRIAGFILFAPTFQSTWVESIADIPVLLVWAKQDQVVPFSGASAVERAFFDVQTLFFDSIIPEGVSKVEAHNPEKFKLEQIDIQIQDWVTYIRKYRAPKKDQ